MSRRFCTALTVTCVLLNVLATPWLHADSVLISTTYPLGSEPYTVKFDAKCPEDGEKLGTITLTLGTAIFTYRDTVTNAISRTYGATIQGGFDIDPAACPMDFRWIQAYTGSPTLYPWVDPTAYTYDRTRVNAPPQEQIADGSPFYANARGPAYGHDLGFYDAPQDYMKTLLSDPTNGATSINLTFNTALVCFEGDDIHMLYGFRWNYSWSLNALGQPVSGGIGFALLDTPASMSNIVDAWNNDPDQATLGDQWNLLNDGTCCECVPLPTAASSGTALLLTALFRRSRSSLAPHPAPAKIAA